MTAARDVLLVEDDVVERRAIARALSARGLAGRLRVARDGEQALDILRGENGEPPLRGPGLVLLDLNLPRMGGLELLRELRRDPALAATRVVVLTTSGLEEDRAGAAAHGVAGYVVKSDPGGIARILDLLEPQVDRPGTGDGERGNREPVSGPERCGEFRGTVSPRARGNPVPAAGSLRSVPIMDDVDDLDAIGSDGQPSRDEDGRSSTDTLDPIEGADPSARGAAPVLTATPLRLLVVDDDVVDRQAVRRMLRRAQLAVELVEVETVAAAAEVLDSGPPIDCVLLDQNLPDGDGLELLARLHDGEPGEGAACAPIIVLTVQDEAALAERCLHLGAQDYLVKGRFDGDGLVRAIRYARERSLLVQELAHKAHALARSNVELERFASVASHDLQEPLRTLAALGERLAKRFDGALGPEGKELVDRMVDASLRMRGLVGDLLELSRVSRGEVPSARVDLLGLLERVRNDLATCFEETGAELLLPGELPHARGDPATLARLFQNLLGNALKFCHPDRSPRIVVSATSIRRGAADGAGVRLALPRIELSVADNGIGFHPGQAAAIFEPFKRLQPRTRFPGSGMGLAIARAIVERHGGRIWAEGQPGQGATFKLTLPAAD